MSKAKAAGKRYATEQIEGSYFRGWVRDQLREASRMDPSEVLPLETREDAEVIARNVLQQLEWDMRRDLPSRQVNEMVGSSGGAHAFYEGFREQLDESVGRVADEILRMRGDRGTVHEAPWGRGKTEWIWSEDLRPGDVILPTKEEGGGEWTVISGPTETTVQRDEHTIHRLEFEVRSNQGETRTTRYPWETGVRIAKRGARESVREAGYVAETEDSMSIAKRIAHQAFGSQEHLLSALSDAGAVALRWYPAPNFGLTKDSRRKLLQVHVRFPDGLIGYYSPGGPPHVWTYTFIPGRQPGDEDLPGTPPDQISKMPAMREAIVADFNTLDDLVEHARRELGATYILTDPEERTIYIPQPDGTWAAARIWREHGYWHAEGPRDREIIRQLPAGAEPIEGSESLREGPRERPRHGTPRRGGAPRAREGARHTRWEDVPYEELLSLAYAHQWSPERDAAQAEVERRRDKAQRPERHSRQPGVGEARHRFGPRTIKELKRALKALPPETHELEPELWDPKTLTTVKLLYYAAGEIDAREAVKGERGLIDSALSKIGNLTSPVSEVAKAIVYAMQLQGAHQGGEALSLLTRRWSFPEEEDLYDTTWRVEAERLVYDMVYKAQQKSGEAYRREVEHVARLWGSGGPGGDPEFFDVDYWHEFLDFHEYDTLGQPGSHGRRAYQKDVADAVRRMGGTVPTRRGRAREAREGHVAEPPQRRAR